MDKQPDNLKGNRIVSLDDKYRLEKLIEKSSLKTPNSITAILYIPEKEFFEYKERGEISELVNKYSFPNFCIYSCIYEIIEKNSEYIVLNTEIEFDFD